MTAVDSSCGSAPSAPRNLVRAALESLDRQGCRCGEPVRTGADTEFVFDTARAA